MDIFHLLIATCAVIVTLCALWLALCMSGISSLLAALGKHAITMTQVYQDATDRQSNLLADLIALLLEEGEDEAIDNAVGEYIPGFGETLVGPHMIGGIWGERQQDERDDDGEITTVGGYPSHPAGIDEITRFDSAADARQYMMGGIWNVRPNLQPVAAYPEPPIYAGGITPLAAQHFTTDPPGEDAGFDDLLRASLEKENLSRRVMLQKQSPTYAEGFIPSVPSAAPDTHVDASLEILKPWARKCWNALPAPKSFYWNGHSWAVVYGPESRGLTGNDPDWLMHYALDQYELEHPAQPIVRGESMLTPVYDEWWARHKAVENPAMPNYQEQIDRFKREHTVVPDEPDEPDDLPLGVKPGPQGVS